MHQQFVQLYSFMAKSPRYKFLTNLKIIKNTKNLTIIQVHILLKNLPRVKLCTFGTIKLCLKIHPYIESPMVGFLLNQPGEPGQNSFSDDMSNFKYTADIYSWTENDYVEDQQTPMNESLRKIIIEVRNNQEFRALEIPSCK